MSNTIELRLAALRRFMEDKHIFAFIIPSSDSHLSEYPASHWASREWISGFDGSAGTVVVTAQKAALWTDSRYFIQADEQLKGTSYLLQKDGLATTPTIEQWLIDELKKGDTVGIDGSVYAAKDATNLFHKLNAKGIQLTSEHDPFTEIWEGRPAIPQNPIFVLPEKYSGQAANDKIQQVCESVEKLGANSLLVSTLDTIAWLFNIRGNDVNYNPVAVCYAFISKKESVLFIDSKKITSEVRDYLKSESVILADYTKIYDYVSKITDTVCVDSAKISLKLYDTIPANCKIIDSTSPADWMKSIKNEKEISGFRTAMKNDGVALVKFLMWLEKEVTASKLKETDIADKLTELRSQRPNYVGNSFGTIAGYAANGAIVHYNAQPETAATIKPEGLLLVDSGGQYFDGTTDITRTLAVGTLTDDMKKDYTMVLKGHINIATAIFPQGTRGSQLDILARKALWDNGINYLHGTGHGIGHFLNVHEGPQSIRMNENPTTLQIGMVTSNEPGVYRAGKYGIRIENLILTQKEITTEFGDFYSFETLTLCPIDTHPIERNMLTAKEIDWLNQYHKMVFELLSPLLNEDEKQWLKTKTNEI